MNRPSAATDSATAKLLNLPPPSLNGGRYTGEAFHKDAPWRNFPALPDAGYLNMIALRSANPPPGAQYQFPGGGLRPGNNTPVLPIEMTDASNRVRGLNLVCVPSAPVGLNDCDTNKQFRGYEYL